MRFGSPAAEATGTPLAPLLDVVLLLLIFFVVTSSFAERALEVELPASESGRPQASEALVLTLDAEGRASVGGVPIEGADLRGRLEEAARALSGVELRAHRATRHEAVVHVLDLAQQAGVESIGVAVSTAGATPQDR